MEFHVDIRKRVVLEWTLQQQAGLERAMKQQGARAAGAVNPQLIQAATNHVPARSEQCELEHQHRAPARLAQNRVVCKESLVG